MVVLGDGLVVADTDLVIDFLRGRSPGAGPIREWLSAGRLRLTTLTAFELRLGTEFLQRRADIGILLGRRTLPLDARAGLAAGEIYLRLRGDGYDIGVKDCLQAGICIRFQLPLATRNVAHFARVEGLVLEPLEGESRP